ncbi:hypothetical protein Pmani_010674 [Petrolisthes manimaculis]|uniref:DNA topoisomerase (ATP-hydrolyzing) n=1 Tax=Petrolisthes manimaculis TaxID=1843537 RepID=A0AAE1Q288_9EUCA|nr:hypothetical protein Pmani_010674 [Petrolisthes manimaculis]
MADNHEFWREIEHYRRIILSSASGLSHTATGQQVHNEEDHNRKVVAACEKIIEEVVTTISMEESPFIRVPKQPRREGVTSEDVRGGGETIVSWGDKRSTRRFSLLLHTLAQSYRHVKSHTFSTRRDVYYQFPGLYGNQSTLDRSAEDLCRMVGVPRDALHLTITGKGLVGGSLTYTTHDGTTVHVAQAAKGVGVPECVGGLRDIQSDAHYVLVVEKDATFQRLLEAQFHHTYGPAIIITGKGYPDLVTRQLVYRLRHNLGLPVLCLTDADPYGLHIAAIYKFGALARDEEGVSVSCLAWVGVLPSDLPHLHLPPPACLPLTPRDYGKLATLAAHPSLTPSWIQQVREQQRLGYKVEIQGLTHIAQDYLTNTYLPSKLRQGGWVV